MHFDVFNFIEFSARYLNVMYIKCRNIGSYCSLPCFDNILYMTMKKSKLKLKAEMLSKVQYYEAEIGLWLPGSGWSVSYEWDEWNKNDFLPSS